MSLRRTPLYDRHLAAGARMVEFAGFEMPVQYSGLREEHARVREAVGLFDVSHMGEVLVEGPHALAAVQWLISNDASTLVDGQAQYTAMPNEQGGIVDDLVVYRLGPERFMICVNAANRAKDFAWMVAHNPHGATFTDVGDDWAQLAVQGPEAVEVVGALTDLDLHALRTYHFQPGTVAGIDGCLVARTGYTGEDGFELFVPSEHAPAAWDAVVEAGDRNGLLPVGLGARDTLRLEVRYPLYGHELTDDTSTWQAGLAWVTKLGKPGGFVGHEALAARKGNEPRRLVGLVVEGKRIPRDGMSVTDGEAVIGYVTSGTRSPSTGHGVALAYVDKAFFKPGSRVVIDVRGKEAPATVHKGPFYRRKA